MGADVSADVIRALVPLGHRFTMDNLWTDQSTYTQAGPRAGLPAPPASTKAVIRAYGEQATSDVYEIRGHRTGTPGPGDRRAGVLWRKKTSPAEDFRGWDVPTTLSAAEAAVWSQGGAADPKTYHPHAIRLTDGTVLATYRWYDGTDNEIRVATRHRDTGVWSEATVVGLVAPGTHDRYPCLVRLPDGLTLLFYWVFDNTAAEAQVRVFYSDDDGGTWTLYQSHALQTPVDISGVVGAGAAGYDVRRLRGAYSNGQLLLLAHLVAHNSTPTYPNRIAQYASDSDGASFARVELHDGSDPAQMGAYPDIVKASAAGFVVGLNSSQSTNGGVAKLLGSAWDKLSGTTAIDASAGSEPWATTISRARDDGDLALWRADCGALYMAARQPTIVGNPCIVVRSVDEGATWETIGQSAYTANGPSKWWDVGTSTAHPRDFCGVEQGGRALILGNMDLGNPPHDQTLFAWYLGGHSTVTMPGYKLFPTETARASWDSTWCWGEDPSACGWTLTGAATQSILAGGRQIASSSSAGYWSRAPSGTNAEGLIEEIGVRTTAGGSLTSNEVAVLARVDDGTSGYEVAIRLDSADQIRLRDVVAGATIATVTAPTADGVSIKLSMHATTTGNHGQVRAWWRPLDSDDDRAWTIIGSTTTLHDDGGTVGNHVLTWGNITAGTATSIWRYAWFTSDQWTGQINELTNFASPADLFPRPLGVAPVWIDAGFRLSMVDGPIRRDEVFTVKASHDYGVERLHPDSYPSPRQMWRGVDGSPPAQATFAWRVGSAGLQPLSDSIAFLVWGNFRFGKIQGYDAGGSGWQDVATVDMATGLAGLAFKRRHDCLVVDTTVSQSATAWWVWGAYDGATVDLGGGVLRKVEVQTEGAWTDTATKRPVLVIKDATGTEPVSGTLNLWAPAALVVCHSPRPVTDPWFHAWRLKVDSQTTFEGYLEAKCLPGPVIPLAQEYSWGRVMEDAPNYELQEWLDGSRFSRPLGGVRSAIEVGWVDGYDETPLFDATVAPDYVSGTDTAGAEPLGTPAGTVGLLARLLRYLDGGHRPLVYAPRIPRGTPDTVTIVPPERWLYGRVVSANVRRSVVVGDEFENEVVRGVGIRIEEEL